jgi:membrane protease YdiL (CAAX protease family)
MHDRHRGAGEPPSVRWAPQIDEKTIAQGQSLTEVRTDTDAKVLPTFPSPAQAAGIVLGLWLTTAAFTLWLRAISVSMPPGLHFILVYIFPHAFVVFVCFEAAVARGESRHSFFLVNWGSPRVVLRVGIISITVFMATLSIFLPIPILYQKSIASFSDTDLLSIATRIAIAPFFEELLWRGIVLRSFLKRMGLWPAILLSSLFFGLAHGNPVLIVFAFVMGCLIGWLYSWTQSIFPGIVIHMAVNAAGVGSSLALPSILPYLAVSALSFAPLVGAVALYLCAFWFRIVIKSAQAINVSPT